MKRSVYLLGGLIIFAVAISTALVFSMSTSDTRDPTRNEDPEFYNFFLRGAGDNSSLDRPISEKSRQYLCGSLLEKNSEFIQEYQMPLSCTQPVGITIDKEDKVWVAGTWMGYLLVFDPVKEQFVDMIRIPVWHSRGDFGSMVWGMKFDQNGDLWFSDQVSSAIWRYFPDEDRFEMYRTPTKNSYPSEIDFDSSGRVWFSEIFGKKLGVIDPSLAKHNSSNGITEYEVTGVEFETMGPLAVSPNHDNAIWFTTVSFPDGGQVVKFDIETEQFTIHELPAGAGVPVGVAEDDTGRLWINDHATNYFFLFDPTTDEFVKYSTSLATSRNNTTTLPYWNMIRDGNLWFNEHEGNAIAVFDIDDSTLVEYQIPSRGQAWGNTSNPLKFDIDSAGSVWFTEWSENKIGVLDSSKSTNLPLRISLSRDTVNFDTKTLAEQSVDIRVHRNGNLADGPVKMTAAFAISPSGGLGNLTAVLNETSFYFNDASDMHTVNISMRPSENLLPGEYTATIGARYTDVTYNRILKLKVQ